MLAPKSISPQKVISLTAVLLATFGLIGWLVYTNFVQVDTGPVPPQWQADFSRTSQVQYPPVPSVDANHPVFTSPQFTGLRAFVQLPVTAGAMGRDNPFRPISYFVGTATPALPPR